MRDPLRGVDPGLLNGRLLQMAPGSPHRLDFPEGTYVNAPGGLHTAGGFYETDEFNSHASIAKRGKQYAQDVWGDSDEEMEQYTRRFGSPLQGMLFHPYDQGLRGLDITDREGNVTPGARTKALQQHTGSFRFRGGGEGGTPDQHREAEGEVRRSLDQSDMPTELIAALGGNTEVRGATSEQDGDHQGSGGWYQPDTGDIVVRRDRRGDGPIPRADTLVHEMGHRADYRSQASEGSDTPDAMVFTPPTMNANPRAEGVADGFMDRYHGGLSQAEDFQHIRDTGYSSSYAGMTSPLGKQWSDKDRAIYTGTRAHFSQTGENPALSGREGVVVNDRSDEFLHMLQRTSPHARKALMEHDDQAGGDNWGRGNLWGAAQSASRRYLGTRKTGTQLSMFTDVRAATVPEGEHTGADIESHHLGYVIDPSLFDAATPEGHAQADAEFDRAAAMIDAFQPPEGRTFFGRDYRHMRQDLYDDPYSNGVSDMEHSKVVAAELKQHEAEKARRRKPVLEQYGLES